MLSAQVTPACPGPWGCSGSGLVLLPRASFNGTDKCKHMLYSGRCCEAARGVSWVVGAQVPSIRGPWSGRHPRASGVALCPEGVPSGSPSLTHSKTELEKEPEGRC